MSNGGLKQARELTSKGFYFDNLIELARNCREEKNSKKILAAYVLNRIFSQMADELGDRPVIGNELRKLEAKYRTKLNIALEKAIGDEPLEDQAGIWTELVNLLWTSSDKS